MPQSAEPPPAADAVVPTAPVPTQPPDGRPGRPSGRRKWLYRLAAAVLVPLLLFGLLEAGLRVGGYGRDTHFFLDGSTIEGPGTLIDNREFGRWVFPRGYEHTPFPVPFVLHAEKPPNTLRVFVLGESAAMGFPEPSVSFPRVLEVMLAARYPETRIEVVNAAMVAINSHIVLPIARECADRHPDLFVVHLGNNEVVGPYGAAGVLGPYAPNRRFIQASLAVRRTRTGQLLSSAAHGIKGDDVPKAWGGMAMFTENRVTGDDDRLVRIREHFRNNLTDICRAGQRAGVPVVVCTVPVNVRESAPFASVHRPGLSPEQTAAWDALFAEGARLEGENKTALAIDRYLAAGEIDDRFADLEFRLGRCLLATGRGVEARERFGRARELDALRFRSDEAVNRTIREVAAERARDGVLLADAERAFDAASPPGGPGENLFLEHVHMNFSGNYLLARTVFEAVVPDLDSRLKAGRASPLTEAECAERLAYTVWNESKVVAQVARDLFRQPPFTTQSNQVERAVHWEVRISDLRARLNPDGLTRAAEVYERAITAREKDWMLRMNYALLLTERGDHESAAEQYREAIRLHKHNFPARVRLGLALLALGRPAEGERQIREALKLAPDWAEAEFALAEVLAAQGKADEGVAIYEQRLATEPDRAGTLLALGAFLFRTGRIDDAERRLTEGLALRPEHVFAHVQLGDIAALRGRKEDALRHYEAALRLRPDWPELRAFLAKVKNEPPPK